MKNRHNSPASFITYGIVDASLTATTEIIWKKVNYQDDIASG